MRYLQGGAPSVGIKTCVVQADLSLPVPVEWAEAGTVEKLTIFPVKSCMGTVVHEAQVLFRYFIERSSLCH